MDRPSTFRAARSWSREPKSGAPSATVEVNDARETGQGSGFLISPRLFITNQHVVRDEDAARSTVIYFAKELDKDRCPLENAHLRSGKCRKLFLYFFNNLVGDSRCLLLRLSER